MLLPIAEMFLVSYANRSGLGNLLGEWAIALKPFLGVSQEKE